MNPNEDIAENDPVRVVDAIVEGLDLREFKKLYHEKGRCPYHPKMMLKIILYAYMNNIYSCRKMERAVQRDIHYIWLAAQERTRLRDNQPFPQSREERDKQHLHTSGACAGRQRLHYS